MLSPIQKNTEEVSQPQFLMWGHFKGYRAEKVYRSDRNIESLLPQKKELILKKKVREQDFSQKDFAWDLALEFIAAFQVKNPLLLPVCSFS